MLSYQQLADLTARSVEGLDLPERPAMLYDPIRYVLETGGKRVRPMLVLASCNLFSDTVDAAVPSAMAIEVFHNFTLLHDDIMDKADVRRGRETVHVRWNPNVAILSGDAMMIYAYELLSGSRPEQLGEILRVFNRLATGVCEGQVFDMEFETRENVTVEEYLWMIELKTSVMLAGGIQMGAIAGGAGPETARKLYRFGINLGLAFQLQDDLLDTYGDPATFGKEIGGDIMCNKKTFLLIHAIERADEVDRALLDRMISNKDQKREVKIATVKGVYDACGVRELTEKAIESYFHEAVTILDGIAVPEDRKQPLREITSGLLKRDR